MTELTRRVIWGLALAAWLLCSGGAWLVAEHQAGRVEREAESAVLARAEVAAEAIEQNLQRTLQAVASLHDLAQSREQLLEAGDRAGVHAIEAQLGMVAHRGRFGVLQVAIIGANGRLVWSSVLDWHEMDLSDREHFRVHRDGYRGLFVSAPLTGRMSGRRSIQLTRAILDQAGRFAGVAVVSVDPMELAHDFSQLRFGPGGSAMVLRRDGVVLARSRSAQNAIGQVFPAGSSLMRSLAASPAGQIRISHSALDQRSKFVGYQALADAPLVVSVGLDAVQEMAPIAFVRPALRAAASAFSAMALAIAGLILLWLERQRTQAALEAARRDREMALEHLAHAQRMEALGRLAGGVAHDINNVLQVVLGGAKLIQHRSRNEGAVQQQAQMVEEAAERGASVTRRLLAFARRGELRAEPVEVRPLLGGIREVLAHTLGTDIRVRVQADPDLPMLFADRGQLETVLLNLAVNARDAMAPDGGGRLTLAAHLHERPAGPTHRDTGLADLPPSRYIYLTVTDTGVGMDAATLARAAEPFFTTKPIGEGTGLGLPMAKGFAEQSGGWFGIESKAGCGTVVTLCLPVASAFASRDAETASDAPSFPQASTAGGRILVVDDEPQVRAVLADTLRESGYDVEEADDGTAALARLARPGHVDLIVTDLAMPGMDGVELLNEARKRCPRLPALLVTGYAGDTHAGKFAAAAGNGPLMILRKPVRLHELADRVAALMQIAPAETV